MRFDSCRQCIRRRIKCDAGEPGCRKCAKKGVSCSGVGKRFRFIDCDVVAVRQEEANGRLAATPGRKRQKVTPSPNSLEKHLSFTDEDAYVSENNDFLTDTWNTDVEAEIISPTLSIAVDGIYPDLGQRHELTIMRSSCLQLLHPKTQMLFDHFSSTVASAMVAVDHESNGYRNIILPLATTDPLIQRAVSVVAALHLAKQRLDLLEPAERGKAAIIQRLHRDALQCQPDQIFNISTWATIILLLVGETVTGDQEFVHLFPMLNSLLKVSTNPPDLHSEATRFLWQQTQMFKLFTPPFLDPAIGVTALQQQLDQYLDWLSHPTASTEVCTALETIKASIYLARDLYLKETRCKLDAADRWLAVEQIKELVHPIQEDTPGMHALVWTYFIAGAASSDRTHREFFLKRLHQVYNRTGMRNVLTTINLLQYSVWRLPENQNWSTSHAILNRVLIM